MNRQVFSAYVIFTFVIHGSDAQLQVRLVNGTAPWNGRLEMLYRGTWGTICGDEFRKEEAQVACRMLGFNTWQAFTVSPKSYEVSYDHFHVQDLRCTGEETSLDQCSHEGIRRDIWCVYVVGITCNRHYVRLRLRDIQDAGPNRSRVDIDIGDGQWQTLCVPSNNTAKVVCRQLGLSSRAAMSRVERLFGSNGNIPPMTNFVFCFGNETSIFECHHEATADRGCRNSIICSNRLVTIHTNSSRYPLMEETNATLKCENNQQSVLINYTWPENTGGFPDGSNLIINRVTRKHHGSRVRCEAISSDGEVVSSDTLELQVYYRPVIRITRSDNQGQLVKTYSEVIKGHNVTFRCDADSNPPPASITWSGKVNSTTGELHIIAAEQTTHNGVYTCTVVTKTHDDDERLPLRASYQLAVIVKVFVSIHTNSSRYPLMEETNATLKCLSNQRSGVINYTWPENPGGFPDGSNLIINRVTRKHNGSRVRCEAISSDGEVVSSDPLELQVYYRPVIRITRSDNQGQPVETYSEVIKGHNVTFRCDADSNPPPASITWSGKVSSTTGELHIIAAEQTRHTGVYTCTVVTETHDDERLPLSASYQLALIIKGGRRVFFPPRYPKQMKTITSDSGCERRKTFSGRNFL